MFSLLFHTVFFIKYVFEIQRCDFICLFYQISYAANSPELSFREMYPRFFRLSLSEYMFNPVRSAFFHHFGWKKVATIHQRSDFFSLVSTKCYNKYKCFKGIKNDFLKKKKKKLLFTSCCLLNIHECQKLVLNKLKRKKLYIFKTNQHFVVKFDTKMHFVAHFRFKNLYFYICQVIV